MGFSWKIHKDQALVVFRASGRSSIMETVEALRELANAPDFVSSLRRLYIFSDDISEGSGLDSTRGPFVDVLASQITTMFDPPATVAFVFSPGNTIAQHRYAVTTAQCDAIYESQGKPPMNRARFDNLADALDWLDIPDGFEP